MKKNKRFAFHSWAFVEQTRSKYGYTQRQCQRCAKIISGGEKPTGPCIPPQSTIEE